MQSLWIRALLIVVFLALAPSACSDKSCLQGECVMPCKALNFTCENPNLYIGPVKDAPLALRLKGGNAGANDIMMSNGKVTAIINQLQSPLDLAPTGGTLIDYGPAGGLDDVTVIYQLAGILPDDAFAYTKLDIDDHRPDYVAITVRGTLDGRRDVKVLTRYELHECDPAVRLVSELFNGSAEIQAFMVADSSHWGKRRIVPFVPLANQGYMQPKLDLLNLPDIWKAQAYVSSATPAPVSSGYGFLACSQRSIFGINDLEVAALGTPLQVVKPGSTLSFERMLYTETSTTTVGQGPAPTVNAMLQGRADMFGETVRRVRGRVIAGGMPFGGDAARSSLMLFATDGGERRPVNATIPAVDGTFTLSAAQKSLELEVWSFGVLRKTMPVPDNGELGDIEVPLPAILAVEVVLDDGSAIKKPMEAIVTLTPADDATRAAVTGTLHGRLATCAPWLGLPTGRSPSCNRILVNPRGNDVLVPQGKYIAVATGGPERTLAQREITLVAGETNVAIFELKPLNVRPTGWLSADLHVHGRASFDSGLPDADRVGSFVATGVDVIAATDHDVINDYANAVDSLGVGDKVAVIGGLETTQVIPWLKLPGEALPKVIGHFNFWPLRPVPSEPRGGAPWDEKVEPGELFDRMAPLLGDAGMMMLNHPWDDPFIGRDLGYLRAIGFDPRLPIVDDGSPNAQLLRRPAGNHRNSDWNIIEIINGADTVELRKSRTLWHSLLSQGYIASGTGNSDSHSLNDSQMGWARNWVDAGSSVATFDVKKFNAALKDGRFVAGNGVVVTVEIGPVSGPRRGLGFTPYHPTAGDVVHIEVRAAPWIPIDEVRIVTSQGEKVVAQGAQLSHPTDPFGTSGILRYQGDVAVASLLATDDFILVEAGLAYPLAADLDNDGVLDTSDNNHDGVVDKSDVEPNETVGPFNDPNDPSDKNDPRYWLTRVVPDGYPEGFANPLIIDVDGNGWNAPGLKN
jgi:hypothetical protein